MECIFRGPFGYIHDLPRHRCSMWPWSETPSSFSYVKLIQFYVIYTISIKNNNYIKDDFTWCLTIATNEIIKL